MNSDIAEKFAQQWVDSWNSHDIDKILAHYSDDLKMTSPVIKLLGVTDTGILHGLESVRNYWLKALELNPQLKFELIQFFTGVNSLVIYYKGHRGLSAETFIFNEHKKVTSAYAHYENLAV